MIAVKTSRLRLRVERREINYLRVTFESYDGTAVVRTVDPQEAVIELHISPGREALVTKLVKDLIEREGMKIRPLD
ncbi:MAG: DUF4911 domain-containing protein [Deltaproteobacteria bacterium]|nr:DUF4911 domain-containing protein [Deltaproteobacteria bacterium]